MIAEIWQTLLGYDKVGRHDNFFELGGHSLLALQMTSRLSTLLKRAVSVRELFINPTLDRFAAAVGNDSAGPGLLPNLVPIRTQGSLPPLFLIHPAGGEIAYAQLLASCFTPDLPIYGLAAQGLAATEIPLQSVQEMATLYLKGIRQIQPHGPYRVAGWSAGGAIAYEIAHQLVEMQESVEFIGLIDSYNHASLLHDTHEPTQSETLLTMLGALANMQASELEHIVALANVDEILEYFLQLNYAPPEIDHAILKRYLDVCHTILLAHRHYSPPPARSPVTLFTSDDLVTSDRTFGWGPLAGDQLQIYNIGGTHYSIVELPHAEKLVQAMSVCLGI